MEPTLVPVDAGARRRWVRSRAENPRWRKGEIGPHTEEPAGTPNPATGGRHWSSRLLHRVNEASSHSATGLTIAVLIIAWVIFGSVTGFPAWWGNVLYVTSSAITLIMVFAIQHTGARQQSATQRKLDELVRSQPTADSRLIAVEEAPDGELEALADLNLADRIQAVNETN